MASSDAELAASILKQVEFYFSDANLPKDKFLWSTVTSSPEGWVSLDTLLKFNRLRALSPDKSIVAAALRQSKELLEVDAAGENVRRIKQLGSRAGAQYRTVFADGIPVDLNDPLAEIEKLFGEAGKIEFVKLFYEAAAATANGSGEGEQVKEAEEGKQDEGNKNKQRKFLGSAFIEFSDAKEAKKALGMSWKLGDKEISVIPKTDYVATHKSAAATTSATPTTEQPTTKDRNPLTLPYLSSTSTPTTPATIPAPKPVLRTPNRLLYVSEIPESTDLNKFKTAVRKFGYVEWVAYKSGESVGFALFADRKRKEKKEGEDEQEKKEEEEKAANDDDKPKEYEPDVLDGESVETVLIERVIARMVKESGEEGKLKMGEGATTAGIRKASEFEEKAFYDDYESQLKRIHEKKLQHANGGGGGHRGGKQGKQGGGGGRQGGQKRKNEGGHGGRGNKRRG